LVPAHAHLSDQNELESGRSALLGPHVYIDIERGVLGVKEESWGGKGAAGEVVGVVVVFLLVVVGREEKGMRREDMFMV